jgi:hypothetical protein
MALRVMLSSAAARVTLPSRATASSARSALIDGSAS